MSIFSENDYVLVVVHLNLKFINVKKFSLYLILLVVSVFIPLPSFDICSVSRGSWLSGQRPTRPLLLSRSSCQWDRSGFPPPRGWDELHFRIFFKAGERRYLSLASRAVWEARLLVILWLFYDFFMSFWWAGCVIINPVCLWVCFFDVFK